MKELQDIIGAMSRARERDFILATVVKTEGSTYRRAGARMLLAEGQHVAGSISGGCLEADVIERARAINESSAPRVVTYDTTSVEDIIWGLGLGCNGIVDVLIEHLPARTITPQMEFLAKCLEQRRCGVLVTLFRLEGEVKARVGGRLMMTEGDGPDPLTTGIDEPELLAQLIEDARVCLRQNQSSARAYQLASGSAEAFVEFIRPPLSLIICGASEGAVTVARFAKELGWHVTVIDSRPFFATRERFPTADEVLISRHGDIPDRLRIEQDAFTAAVLMTHNYLQDRSLLEALLLSPLSYIGVLGSRRRTSRLLDELQETIGPLSLSDARRLHAPTGLDIGAETPQEIALAIIAEIQAVHARRRGGLLRNRRSFIHQRGHMTDQLLSHDDVVAVTACAHSDRHLESSGVE